MTNSAIILTDGKLSETYGKTAHGLITGQSRFPVAAVIDPVHAGKDAGSVVDGKARHIPIFARIQDAISNLAVKPTHCIVGVATPGGYLTDSLVATISTAIEHKLIVVNGLHELVSEHPKLKPLIQQHQATIMDIRKPKAFHELHPWSGAIQTVKTPRIAVLGMDCAIGKRTTCQMLYKACNEADIKTEMIYTGQTGWLQGFKYGFIFDSTLNDFVSGEVENAIVTCVKEVNPTLILIEGQSSLRNPSGPCGAEFIVSGGAKGVILQHVPGRQYFSHGDKVHFPLPSLQDEIDLIQRYGTKVLAVCVNTKHLGTQTWQDAKQIVANECQLPVVCPREEGVTALLPIIKQYIEGSHR